jgi:hypothetical protein
LCYICFFGSDEALIQAIRWTRHKLFEITCFILKMFLTFKKSEIMELKMTNNMFPTYFIWHEFKGWKQLIIACLSKLID